MPRLSQTTLLLTLTALLSASCAKARLIVHAQNGGKAPIGADATPQPAAPATTTPSAMPSVVPGMPATFKELGLFTDGALDKPVAGVVPYNVKVSLWSDNVAKSRFVYTPSGTKITYDKNSGTFSYPPGTALIKNFARANGENIETRVILQQQDGTWTVGAYQWNGTDAKLLVNSALAAGNAAADPSYHIPSHDECQYCHYSASGNTLGFKPEQFNWTTSDGTTQLAALIKAGVIDSANQAEMAAKAAMPDPADTTLDLNTRVYSYIALNCAVCHNPTGPAAFFDLSPATLASPTKLLAGKFVVPGKPESSVIWERFALDKYRMPPQSTVIDPLGAQLLKEWINAWPVPVPTANTTGTSTTNTTGTTNTDAGTTSDTTAGAGT